MKKILLGVFVFMFLSFPIFAQGKMDNFDMQNFKKATFAGGCFWCMQPPFDKLEGVVSTTVGYTGGHKKDPTYREVTTGKTGHAEAIEVLYDPAEVTYEKLLKIFWMNINPTTPDRQFADVGTQYRPAVFYHDEKQKKLAEKSRLELDHSGRFHKPIATEITAVSKFYPAEEYHQKYYKKNPIHYKMYSVGSGRVGYLKKVWGK